MLYTHLSAPHGPALAFLDDHRHHRFSCRGKNSQGQCGLGHTDDVLRPAVVASLLAEVIVQIAAGWEHTLARTLAGTLYSWGSGYKDSRRGLVPPGDF